jgi:hypothetical protein
MAEPISAVSIGGLVATGAIVGTLFAGTGIAVNEAYQNVVKPAIVGIGNELERDYNYLRGAGHKTAEEIDKELEKTKHDNKLSELKKLLNKYNSPAEENTNRRLLQNFKQ